MNYSDIFCQITQCADFFEDLAAEIINQGGGTGGGTLSFDITDGTNSQTIVNGNDVLFQGSDLLEVLVTATDTVTIGMISAPNGSITYFDGTNWVTLPPGANGEVLTLVGGNPSWEAATGGGSSCQIAPIVIPDSAFADPLIPMMAELDAWFAANKTDCIGQQYKIIGNGTADIPDYVLTDDGDNTYTLIETCFTGGGGVSSALRPWGTDTTIQPTSGDDVAIGDDIHHEGPIYLGIRVGDWTSLTGEQANILAFAGIGGTDITFYSRSDVGGVANWFESETGVVDDNIGSIQFKRSSYLNKFQFNIHHRNDDGSQRGTQFAIDRDGNFSNNDAFNSNASISGEHIQIFRDGTGNHATVAPSAPYSTEYAHLWAADVGGTAELFTMDGAGNVTQLSSHPVIASQLMPPPESHPNAQYSFSYNVIARIGTMALEAGMQSKSLVFDIDSGDYEIFDASGASESTGNEPVLLEYAARHASDSEFDALEPDERWEHMEDQRENKAATAVSQFNDRAAQVGTEQAIREFGGRPELHDRRSQPENVKLMIEAIKERRGTA